MTAAFDNEIALMNKALETALNHYQTYKRDTWDGHQAEYLACCALDRAALHAERAGMVDAASRFESIHLGWLDAPAQGWKIGPLWTIRL